VAEQVNPTRMNLLARRSQIRLARQGADLLNRKKDALLREFFDLVAEVYQLRSGLAEDLRREATEAIVAEAVEGKHALAAASTTAPADFQVRLRPRNLWGVRIIDVEHTYRVRDVLSRPFSPRTAELALDEVARGFEQIVARMLDLAPRELRLRRIGDDIRRTNRKINALEQQLIPRLESQARAINQVLEERARDDVVRLKRLKQKKERASR
jgi:V/A-type H+-transporting ATPase subunit D